MKTLDVWLHDYGVSHQTRANRALHKLCVPLIFLSIVGLLSLVRRTGDTTPLFSLASVIAALSLGFYARLGVKPLGLMILVFAFSFAFLTWLQPHLTHPAYVYVAVFGLGWIGQFIGHAIEGKKPSFIEDLSFLLIGPLWIFLGRVK